MINKKFSEQLNKALDNIDAPVINVERIEVLSKLIKIPKFKAEAFLNGMVPDDKILNTLASELEVSIDWLIGKNKQSH